MQGDSLYVEEGFEKERRNVEARNNAELHPMISELQISIRI